MTPRSQIGMIARTQLGIESVLTDGRLAPTGRGCVEFSAGGLDAGEDADGPVAEPRLL
jgi:hypothetical protein